MSADYKTQALNLLVSMLADSDNVTATLQNWAAACVKCGQVDKFNEFLTATPYENSQEWFQKLADANLV